MSYIDLPNRATNTRRRVNVMQGEARVTTDPRVELTTVLGSCIATCLFDATEGVGGMNHYLLAEPRSGARHEQVDEHYGVYLMEVLINEMLAWGARKANLRAHVYGGADMHAGMTRIGSANARFVAQFLESERIPLVHSDLGGSAARRIDFQAAVGRSRCRVVSHDLAPSQLPMAPRRVTAGDVELF